MTAAETQLEEMLFNIRSRKYNISNIQLWFSAKILSVSIKLLLRQNVREMTVQYSPCVELKMVGWPTNI